MTEKDLIALRKNDKLLVDLEYKMNRFVPMTNERIMDKQSGIKTRIKLLRNALFEALKEHRRQNKHKINREDPAILNKFST